MRSTIPRLVLLVSMAQPASARCSPGPGPAVRRWLVVLALVSSMLASSSVSRPPAAAAAGPGGAEVVVPIEGAILGLDQDSGAERVIAEVDAGPTVASPSGDVIAARTFMDNEPVLVLVDRDGSDVRTLATDASTAFGGGMVWSPDGAELAVATDEGLVLLDRAGNRTLRLASESVTPRESCRIPDSRALTPMGWSPQDELLVIAWADCGEDQSSSDLLLLAAGAGPPRVAIGLDEPVFGAALGEGGEIAARPLSDRTVVFDGLGRREAGDSSGVAWSRGRLALVDERSLRVLEPGAAQERLIAELSLDYARGGVAWDPAGQVVAIAGLDSPVERVDMTTGERTVLRQQGARPFVSWLPAIDVAVQRLAGAERLSTAVAVSRSEFPDGTGDVVLARADDPADALSGAALAASLDAPILLAWPDRLPTESAAELERLDAERVVVLGGRSALAEEVLDAARRGGRTVERVAGPDRYGTAAAVAGRLDEGPARVFVANGHRYADALGAAPLSAALRAPLLLVGQDFLPDATARALRDAAPDEVVLAGGGQVVSAGVEQALADACACRVTRVAGVNRSATSARLADLARTGFGFDPERAVLARGDNVVDALAGAVHAGRTRAPLLLTPGPAPLGDELQAWFAQQPGLRHLTVLGDATALTRTTVRDAWQATAP